jgi:hypothetical protein
MSLCPADTFFSLDLLVLQQHCKAINLVCKWHASFEVPLLSLNNTTHAQLDMAHLNFTPPPTPSDAYNTDDLGSIPHPMVSELDGSCFRSRESIRCSARADQLFIDVFGPCSHISHLLHSAMSGDTATATLSLRHSSMSHTIMLLLWQTTLMIEK